MRLLLLSILLLATPALAQPAAPAEGPPRATDRALLFSMEGVNPLSSDLSAFRGGVGMKWWRSGGRALSVGVRAFAAGEEQEYGDGRGGSVTVRDDRQSAEVFVGVEAHRDASRRLSPFVGVFGGVGVDRFSRHIQPSAGSPGGEVSAGQTAGVAFAGASVGVEYQLTRDLAVAIRQGAQARVRLAAAPAESEGARSGWAYSLGTLGAPTLTVSVYF